MHDVTINPEIAGTTVHLSARIDLMPTSLTLDTARCNDGKLVLIAAGEIDLSNIETFDHALTHRHHRGRGRRV